MAMAPNENEVSEAAGEGCVRMTASRIAGLKARIHGTKEVLLLCEHIHANGTFSGGDGQKCSIKFGKLFELYNKISNKVVGTLLHARKHGLVEFPGETLFQRQNDETVILMPKSIEDIRLEMAEKINKLEIYYKSVKDVMEPAAPFPKAATSVRDRVRWLEKRSESLPRNSYHSFKAFKASKLASREAGKEVHDDGLPKACTGHVSRAKSLARGGYKPYCDVIAEKQKPYQEEIEAEANAKHEQAPEEYENKPRASEDNEPSASAVNIESRVDSFRAQISHAPNCQLEQPRQSRKGRVSALIAKRIRQITSAGGCNNNNNGAEASAAKQVCEQAKKSFKEAQAMPPAQSENEKASAAETVYSEMPLMANSLAEPAAAQKLTTGTEPVENLEVNCQSTKKFGEEAVDIPAQFEIETICQDSQLKNDVLVAPETKKLIALLEPAAVRKSIAQAPNVVDNCHYEEEFKQHAAKNICNEATDMPAKIKFETSDKLPQPIIIEQSDISKPSELADNVELKLKTAEIANQEPHIMMDISKEAAVKSDVPWVANTLGRSPIKCMQLPSRSGSMAPPKRSRLADTFEKHLMGQTANKTCNNSERSAASSYLAKLPCRAEPKEPPTRSKLRETFEKYLRQNIDHAACATAQKCAGPTNAVMQQLENAGIAPSTAAIDANAMDLPLAKEAHNDANAGKELPNLAPTSSKSSSDASDYYSCELEPAADASDDVAGYLVINSRNENSIRPVRATMPEAANVMDSTVEESANSVNYTKCLFARKAAKNQAKAQDQAAASDSEEDV